jgi:ABC-2 type transport system ATP-binding protein
MSIQVKEVSKYYGQQAALQSISFKVNKGEIVGFLGPNGAGKSTLMKIISNYLIADEGQVEVCQENVEKNPLSVRQKVGYLAEHNPLYLEMYIKEYLGFIADLYGCSKKQVSKMIELTRLSPEQHKKIGELSKGYRQRVGLAAALIHDPEVLILDEPTTGLDPNQLVEIRNLIKDNGKNKTVMLSTHIMQEVEKMCNRVIIINKGKIVADEQLKSLKAKKIDLESYFQQLTAKNN